MNPDHDCDLIVIDAGLACVVESRRISPDVVILDVRGDLNAACAKTFAGALRLKNARTPALNVVQGQQGRSGQL